MPRALRNAVVALLCLVCAQAAAAQESLVLVHGFFSAPEAWSDASARWEQQLAVRTYRPGLPDFTSYQNQATQLQHALSYLPASTVAVGHSNGGIVSRKWSAAHPLQAIVTLNSPHAGAPLAQNAVAFVGYNWDVFDRIFDLELAFGGEDYAFSWGWVYNEVLPAVLNAYGFGRDSIAVLGASLLESTAAPIVSDMKPSSAHWQTLNSDTGLSLEAARVPTRLGIINIPDDFFEGGIFRGFFPGIADAAADIMDVSTALLDFYGYYLLVRVAEDDRHFETAMRMFALSNWIAGHELLWCQTVSDPTFTFMTPLGICMENDGILPIFSMVYPGGMRFQQRTPATHTEVTRDTALLDYTAELLVRYTQITPAGAPPPPPPPPGSTPPASDTNSLIAGEKLVANARITSADARYRFTYQSDGNLVLRYSDGTPLWSSKTAGTTTKYTAMQGDGNLVIYNGSGAAVWHSKTHGHAGAWTIARNDGNVTVRMPSGTVLWQTGTAGMTGTGGSTCGSNCGSSGILGPDTQLNPGQSLYSSDGKYKLGYQTDGNLVLRRVSDGAALWASGTQNTGGAGKARMQSDGNFVLRNSAGTAVWSTRTNGNTNAYLKVRNDAYFVIYNAAGTSVLWSSKP